MTGAYQIRSGDNLTAIAGFYEVDLDALLELNPQIIDPNFILAGQTINVPDASNGRSSIHASLAPQMAGVPPWYRVALREMDTGIEEIGRPGRHNERIIEYHQTTTLRATDDETPWCSSFVNWCLGQAGVEGTNSAAARSWLGWGHGLDEPRVGCVVIFSRPPNPKSGHVAFFAETHANRVLALGGNQANTVKLSGYPADRVLGYRWPDQKE